MSTTIFGIRAGKRVEVVIDGMHLYNVCRSLGFEIDYAALRLAVFEDYDCRKINYVMKVAYNDEGEIQQPTIAKMLDFLRYNGHHLIISEMKEWVNAEGRRIVRNSVDIHVTCAMLQAAAAGIDEIIVFAGSEDIIPAVVTAREMGARTTIVSSTKTPQIMVAPELRSTADWFVDIASVKDKFTRRERETYQTGDNTEPSGTAVVVEDRRESIFGVGGNQRQTSLGARMRVSRKE